MPSAHTPAFQLMAYPGLPMADAMQLARAVLDRAGAMVADIQRFSNKQIVFQINVRIGDWSAFLDTMLASELRLDTPQIRGDLAAWADADGDLFGTVSVLAAGGEPERMDVIAQVPG